MKKILSSLLAFAMMLAMFSGVIIFSASAEEVEMHIPFINQYTLAQAQKMGKNNGWAGSNNYSNASNYTISKDDDGRTVVSCTLPEGLSEQWKTCTAYLSTGTNATPFVKDGLIDNINIFGDAELSNKTKIAIKFDGDANFKSAFTGCNLMLNSGTERVCLSLQGPTKSNGYLIYDFSKITRNNYDESGIALPSAAGNFHDAFDGRVSTLNMALVFNKTSLPVTFWIDDVYLVGAADTVDLHRAIREGKAAGLTGKVISDAEAVYLSAAPTKAQIDAAIEAIDAALDEITYGVEKLKKDLDDLLMMADDLGFFDSNYAHYNEVSEADLAYSNANSTEDDYRYHGRIVRMLVAEELFAPEVVEALGRCVNAWQYNYTDKSYKKVVSAVDEAWALLTANAKSVEDDAIAILNTAYDALVPVATRTTTANFFEGWTTAQVNDVVDANSAKLCDSIGEGLNIDGAWNAGDFTNNTTFEADSNFSMTANADFTGKAMGWKNMDRSGTLATGANYAYPTMNVAGLSEADGVRFKLVSTGDVQRILIGLSNCASTTREMYAMKIRPEFADEDGYINIPFSYFEKAFWCNAFSQAELENVIVFIIECYGVEEDTTVTVSDFRGYKSLGKASAEQLAKVADITEKLKAFDIDGRYADLIAEAEELDETAYDADCEDVYNRIFAILKGVGDPSAAIVDVPGYSIYTQEELNLFPVRGGSATVTKVDDGVTVSFSKSYRFWNGTVVNGASTGYGDDDCDYGQLEEINGKTLIDMLGGYSLTDIYAYRFKIDGGGAYVAVNYKDGIGLWSGMVTKAHTVYKGDDGYFTFVIDNTPTDKFDNWYGGNGYAQDNATMREHAKFIGFDFDPAKNSGKLIHGWQVILYEAIDRAELKAALVANAGKGLASYDDAMETYYDADADQDDVDAAVAQLGLDAALSGLGDVWEYNYTADSWTAFSAAADAAQTAEDVDAALALLVPLNIKPVTGNLFDGWTTKDVNDVVTANSDRLCDSIGNGLNENNVWNGGDFSNNTTFAADNNFSMTATADFTGKSIGWKNMDRSKTLQPADNGAFPALNVAGLSKAEGIRFKLEVNGKAERLLIGLSNCSKFVREQYALSIKPEYTLENGYINIPFKYFVNAWWCESFAQEELEDVIVFIVEAYGVAKDTTITISDLVGYKTLVSPTDEDFAALDELVATLEEYDLDGTHFADAYALAESVANAEDREDVLAAIDELQAIVDNFCAPIRKDIKAKLEELIALDVTDYFADEIADFTERYYGALSNNSAVMLMQEIQGCIDQFVTPEAPAAPEAETVEYNRIVLVAVQGIEYKCDDGEWQESNEFANLTPNTEYTFYARYSAHGVSSASEPSEGTKVSTVKEVAAGSVVVNGDFRYGTEATATVELNVEGTYDYAVEWYTLTGTLVATGETYTFAADDIGATFFVKVSSADLEGALQSDAFGPIGKGVVTVTAEPTADLLPLGMTLSEAILSGGVADVDGVWAFTTPDVIPEYEQSGSEFDVVFTPTEADLYEEYTCKVVVEINAVTEPKVVVNTQNGLVELSGDFHNLNVTTFEMEKITPTQTAYFDLLRAANRSGSDKNIIFTYSIDFGTAIAPYIGTLTIRADVSADRAGETYTVWFFTKDGVVGKEGTVNADGTITVEGLRF